MTHHLSTRPEPGSTRRRRRFAAAALAAGALVLGTSVAATSLTFPGTPGKDVHIGGDNDNADNPFIQPPGVTAKQHMDNTDVLFGRGNDDLLIGKLGDDTLLGGGASDILVGGPEKGTQPNSDVLLGDPGADINIWAPGDGSDAFIGHQGWDTMIFAPFVERANGELLLTRSDGRRIPRVDIDGQAAFSCTIVDVPASENLGFEFLVRFNVNGTPVVTVRQRDVETVFCPSPHVGRALVADLTDHEPEFRNVRLNRVPGTVGNILEPVG
ncbi:hypothetical protein [Nocardioides sp.]|uniref:hypothetical protein n=1 Tax=Nocardioides sp. TaxID=35761 RepID=UPI002ED405B9